MGKIIQEFTTKYDVGDIVIFQKGRNILCGIIEGYYVEDDYFYFNIRLWKDNVLTYSNGGDVGEYDIIGKVENDLADSCRERIIGEYD